MKKRTTYVRTSLGVARRHFYRRRRQCTWTSDKRYKYTLEFYCTFMSTVTEVMVIAILIGISR